MIKLLQVQRRAPGWPIRRTIWWWTIVRTFLRMLMAFTYRLQVRGYEHVPPTGPIIYVANHQSNLDPILTGIVAFDRPFSGIARATLFHSKLLSWLMRSIGVIPIAQGKGDKGAMDAALGELAAGRTVCIFPEGTRTRDGKIGDFQRGVMLLIRRSGAPVVPMAIEGAFEVWPMGQKLPRLRGRIAVQAAPAIGAEELLRNGADAGLDQLKKVIAEMHSQLRSQIRRRSRPAIGQEPANQATSRQC